MTANLFIANFKDKISYSPVLRDHFFQTLVQMDLNQGENQHSSWLYFLHSMVMGDIPCTDSVSSKLEAAQAIILENFNPVDNTNIEISFTCAQVICTKSPIVIQADQEHVINEAIIKNHFSSIQNYCNYPINFICDLTKAIYNPLYPLHKKGELVTTQGSIVIKFSDSAPPVGIVITLSLERIPSDDQKGKLYPHPYSAFIPLDNAFKSGLEHAAKAYPEIWIGHDIRWHICFKGNKNYDLLKKIQAIEGASLSGAFAMLMMSFIEN